MIQFNNKIYKLKINKTLSLFTITLTIYYYKILLNIGKLYNIIIFFLFMQTFQVKKKKIIS